MGVPGPSPYAVQNAKYLAHILPYMLFEETNETDRSMLGARDGRVGAGIYSIGIGIMRWRLEVPSKEQA